MTDAEFEDIWDLHGLTFPSRTSWQGTAVENIMAVKRSWFNSLQPYALQDVLDALPVLANRTDAIPIASDGTPMFDAHPAKLRAIIDGRKNYTNSPKQATVASGDLVLDRGRKVNPDDPIWESLRDFIGDLKKDASPAGKLRMNLSEAGRRAMGMR